MGVPEADRIEMSQRERDLLKVMGGVLDGERTQAEAAGLLGLSTRQVRRLQRKLEAGGDAAIVHGLRGRPSNHQGDHDLKRAALEAYRTHYPDFGPTFASEKLAEGHGLVVCPQTLRRWLIAAGLWSRKRRREAHRSRRPRRDCFGELVQMDASIHDWLEGRGEPILLISMIDDATSYLMARFYTEGTVLTHMDLLSRWLRRHGRPLALYTDRHSIFEPQDKGKALPGAQTQFGRALGELGIDLIRAHSPQAKGRVERCFNTAQDRWVKELRLAKAATAEQANGVLDRLLPGHNRKFAKKAREQSDAHRPLGPSHDLAAILSVQEARVVSNDYTVRFANRFYQLLPPVYPGQRGGKVVIECRLDGTLAIRFQTRYLPYREVTAEAEAEAAEPVDEQARRPVGPAAGGPNEGTADAPPGSAATSGPKEETAQGRRKPAADHPWRQGFNRPRK
jgi:Helix-turn-helix domain